MKLAVSAIAWDAVDEEEAFGILHENHVAFIECVPARFLDDPGSYASRLKQYGLTPVAFQALLFGTTGLHLFQEPSARQALDDHLRKVFQESALLGGGSFVFGAPKNRWIDPLYFDLASATAVASDFFQSLTEPCRRCHATICIEPNPPAYGCNFLYDTSSTGGFVRRLDSPSIALNFDLGTTIINAEAQQPLVESLSDVIGHVHISEPQLFVVQPKGEFSSEHRCLASALRSISYSGVISIEMRRPATPDWRSCLQRAIEEVRDVYGAT